MKVLTLVKKQVGYCNQSAIRNMQKDVKETCVTVKKFKVINLENGRNGKKVYTFDTNKIKGYKFIYEKGQYVPLSTVRLWVFGVVVVGGYFAYKKFKK
tara:strand:+ start:1392 stop:1685 length:294 start_codon:yes stop_codon:yes gene_type:complete